MTPKEYLERIKRLDRAATAAMRQYDSIKSDIERITPNYSKPRVAGAGQADMSNAVTRLITAQVRTDTAIEDYVNEKLRIITQIDRLDDPDDRLLLTLRYVDYMRWDDIAGVMHYNKRWVMRLHGRALEKMAYLTPRRG